MYTMAEMRRTDKEPKKWFRSSRFFKENGSCYFYTREATMEGPFDQLERAQERLAEYIKIMNSGFMPDDSSLRVEPKLEPKKTLKPN
jgi:hypothetical protein